MDLTEVYKELEDLEERVRVLRKSVADALCIETGNTAGNVCRDDMIRKYGDRVDKTVAAKLLGVTRATIYNMLADGRLIPTCKGHKVLTASIADYINSPY